MGRRWRGGAGWGGGEGALDAQCRSRRWNFNSFSPHFIATISCCPLLIYIYFLLSVSSHALSLSLSLYAFFRSFYQYSQQNRFNPLQRKTVLYRYIRTSHKTLTTTATQITYNLKIITSFLNSRKIFNINPTPTSSPVSLLISLYLFSSLLDISLKYSLLPD